MVNLKKVLDAVFSPMRLHHLSKETIMMVEVLIMPSIPGNPLQVLIAKNLPSVFGIGCSQVQFAKALYNYLSKSPQTVDGHALRHCNIFIHQISRDSISHNAQSRSHLLQCAMTKQARAIPFFLEEGIFHFDQTTD
jgi:hypothetical protein